MTRQSAISMPMAPVKAAVRHMLLTSGSMGALPLTHPGASGQVIGSFGQNFDDTARKVILSLVSRSRPASVRTKFQSRS